jgi:cell division protein FtsI/penicillin-binding protein 2
MVYISGADGLNKETLYEEPAQNGLDIQLSLDPDLQSRTEVLLKYSLFGDDTAGAVVVLDPVTGRVEAMASYPRMTLTSSHAVFPRRIGRRLPRRRTNPCSTVSRRDGIRPAPYSSRLRLCRP